MRITKTFLVPRLLLPCIALLGACAATPSGPPDAVAQDILLALESGDAGRADDLFQRVERNNEYTEKIYPVLYDAASARKEQGDFAISVTMLRFLAAHYPRANAVREALLYGLFLERAAQTPGTAPDPALLDEIEANLAALGGRSSVWIDLAETQYHIDRGSLDEARASFQRFSQAWDGSPPSLVVYVDDITRYLVSH